MWISFACGSMLYFHYHLAVLRNMAENGDKLSFDPNAIVGQNTAVTQQTTNDKATAITLNYSYNEWSIVNGKESPLMHSNNGTAANQSLISSTSTSHCRLEFPLKCQMYEYVRFWNVKMSPHDCYESPLRPASGHLHEQKFLVFEPDQGGWNNIRMAAETAIIFAHATGRTLVLPPPGYWYLMTQSKVDEDNLSSFNKFFDISKFYESMTIISMQEFLEKVAKSPGMLKQTLPATLDVTTLFRPREKLYKYIANACYVAEWAPFRQFIGFNMFKSSNTSSAVRFAAIDTNLTRNHRLREMIMTAPMRKLRVYDEALHHEKAIFFPGDYRQTHRLLAHFYTYLYWEDLNTAKLYRRLARDRLRYHDNIFCDAGIVVRWLHEDSARYLPSRPIQRRSHYHPITKGGDTRKAHATYFAIHVRRGDFQFSETQLSAERIWSNAKDKFNPNISRIIYISTDEKNHTFFEPFHRSGEFHLRFFDDYRSRLARAKGRKKDVDPNLIGMIEQVICANAHTFVGTPKSTFTGYITRMRGYYRDGRYNRTFYTKRKWMYQLQQQHDMIQPFWAREFVTAHEDIDDITV